MEAGLLNFHDDEHFPTFSDDNNVLGRDTSILNGFIEVLNEDFNEPWTIPENETGLGFEPLVSDFDREDYNRSFNEWQMHISNLQDDEDGGNLFPDTLREIPDAFTLSDPIPQNKVPKKDKVQTYKVAKRKGLVMKITKQKSNEDCDKTKSQPKKKAEVQAVNKSKLSQKSQRKIKKEPLDDFEVGKPAVKCKKEKKSSLSKKRQRGHYKEDSLPKIKIEKDNYLDYNKVFQETPKIPDMTSIKIKAEKIDSPQYDYTEVDSSEFDCTQIDPSHFDVFGLETFNLKTETSIKDEHLDVDLLEPMEGLQAGDMTTLLEQFESSSPVKDISEKSDISMILEPIVKKEKVLEEEEEDYFSVNSEDKSVTELDKIKTPVSTLKPSNKSIMEAFPKEVIDRIKESSQRNKKHIPVVPAERLPLHGNEHMKDAGAIQVKTIRMMSNQRSSGDSAQLDHDYCTNQHDLNKRIIKEENFKPEWEKKWDSKKDSGLESGDVSDSSETLERSRGKQSPSGTICREAPVKQVEEAVQIKEEPTEIDEQPKKKKLNLEEYRNRRKNTKPKSPIKCKSGGWNIPTPKKENENETNKATQMVNAEVQVQIDYIKTDPNAEKREPEGMRRRSTSSSPSPVNKSRYCRRARSRRRRHSRGQRSYLSNSRSRSRSYSRSRSRSQSRSSSYSSCKTRSCSKSRSRTRSQSRSSSYSACSSSSRSRSRSRGGSYRRYRSRSGYRRSSSHRYSSREFSKRKQAKRSDDWSPVEKLRQVEERRVIYVGRLEEGTTKAQLRERFNCFGPIVDISLHFREKGDNYGFVTFGYKVDAYEAVEHGNDYPLEPKYDICFGGRRAFCKQRYSDLDGTSPQSYSPHQQNSRSSDSFDYLLREAQKKLKRSNHV